MKNKNRSENKNVTYRQRAFNRTFPFRGPIKQISKNLKKSIIPNIENIQKLISLFCKKRLQTRKNCLANKG